MFNRKQYMAHECSHDEYYRQFATESVVRFVGSAIGKKTIAQSTDKHFNDIPLRRWDALAPGIQNLIGSKIAESNASTTVGNVKTISLSDLVCTAKAAARLIKEAAIS